LTEYVADIYTQYSTTPCIQIKAQTDRQ